MIKILRLQKYLILQYLNDEVINGYHVESTVKLSTILSFGVKGATNQYVTVTIYNLSNYDFCIQQTVTIPYFTSLNGNFIIYDCN